MVQKIRKAMPKKKENKLDKARKQKISDFVKRKPANKKPKRENQYVFTGFYERLKAIDVKQTHSSLNELNFRLDHLNTTESGAQMEDDDLQNSVFIQLLKSEKFNNRTPEFTRVFRDIEGLSFSLPLLIMNKAQITAKLLGYFDDQSLTVVHCVVIDLIIALIKDLRQEIYEAFMHDILPKVIGIIDAKNLPLMDKIFQLLSISFKFLTKPIKDNIQSVYDIYFELLKHKSHFIRKFTAQSFSYVIRKLPFEQTLIKMLFAVVANDNHEDCVQGLSDLLFEVLSGSGEDLHSKGQTMVNELFKYTGIFRAEEAGSRRVLRYLYLKLINNIDISKQMPLFEELTSALMGCLAVGDEVQKQIGLTLLFQVMNDSVRLKYGKRFCQEAVILFTQTLNNLLSKHIAECAALSAPARVMIAETLGMLYYFKHAQVVKIFQDSNLDFQTAKSAFTNGIYRISTESSIAGPVLTGYFKLLFQKADTIEAQPKDIDFGHVLSLKSTSQVVVFAEDAHRIKAKMLMKSLARQTFNVLSQSNKTDEMMTFVSLLVSLVEVTGKNYNFELSEQVRKNIRQLITSQTQVQLFVLAKFLSVCHAAGDLQALVLSKASTEPSRMPCLNLAAEIESNQVIKRYPQVNHQRLEEAIRITIDLQNHGFTEQISHCTRLIATDYSKGLKISQALSAEDASNLLALRLAQKLNLTKMAMTDCPTLALALIQNLSKNSRPLRLATLAILDKAFTELNYVEYNYEKHGSLLDLESAKKHYSGACPVLSHMVKMEASEISIDSEKQKASCLRNVQQLLSTGLVPEMYMNAIYHFLIGCFWVKFLPLQAPTIDCLKEVFVHGKDLFVSQHIQLFESFGHICQIAETTDVLMDILLKSVGCSKLALKHSTQQGQSEDAMEKLHHKIYLDNSRTQFEINNVKDFHFLLAKAMIPVIDLIMTSPVQRQCLYQSFETFYECEYLFLHRGKQRRQAEPLLECKSIEETMMQANLVDSDTFKVHRKTSYSKLCATLELLSKSSALNKLPSEKSKVFIDMLTSLLNTSDTHLQQLVLSCLIKASKKQDFANPTLKLPKYQKLLEGLTDDQHYKDMIPIIIFGSQEGATEALQDIENEEQTVREAKRNIKGTIPKLEKEDRLEVLPYIIKILFSKLLRKKGAINKKKIDTRRNIVYQFLSGLDPKSEFQLFFDELLEPLGIKTLLDDDVISEDLIKQKLAFVSFSQLLTFIASLEVIFKQLGNLLMYHKHFLTKLAKVLVLTISLAKDFLGHLKGSRDESEDEDKANGTLYEYVGKQSKHAVRRGLHIVKQLYSKFNTNASFIQNLSETFYRVLLVDQLDMLHERYISERSMLVEILTLSWSHPSSLINYSTYPLVLPALMRMLSAPKIDASVVQMHFQLVKNLVVASLQNGDESQRKHLQMIVKINNAEEEKGEDVEMSDESEEQRPAVVDEALARRIIEQNTASIGEHLFAYWSNHQDKLRLALTGPKRRRGQPIASKQLKEQIAMQMTVKDLIFVISELSTYLVERLVIKGFLSMLIQLVGMRSFLAGGTKSEELVMFACQAITSLLGKTLSQESVEVDMIEKVCKMLLTIQSKAVRIKLCQGLQEALGRCNQISTEVLGLVVDLNSVRHGLADVALDFDKVFAAIKTISTIGVTRELEVNLLTYCTLHLLTCDEYSVRDYALHALSNMIPKLELKVFKVCEQQLVSYIRNCDDEMVLKSILQALKLTTETANKNKTKFGETLSFDLIGLLSHDGSQEDFFSTIVSMQLQTRQKALRKLKTLTIPVATFRTCVLPLVDFLIFDAKVAKLKERGTVRYTKDQTAQLLEDALNVYQSYAKRLKWRDLFMLVKMLIYKIDKASKKSIEIAAVKSDLEHEKVLTKCLCKVLEGFAQSEVITIPDAVATITQKAASVAKKPNEFSALLKEMVSRAKTTDAKEEEDVDMEASDEEEESEEEDAEAAEFDIIQASKRQMEGQATSTVLDMQKKLALKILPLLSRHLTEIQTKIATNETTPIRSYVAVCIAKIIRKLPVSQFTNQLNKLVNLIVVKGLRAKDLQTREKARKALLKVVGEVSPQFLTLIVEEMKQNLDRGYQLHVFLYTLHYILNHLTQNATSGTEADYTVSLGLQTGQITSQLIQSTSDLLTREMFGDLYEEKMLTDTKKKHIKESKARKAFPIFEVYAEYIDFQDSFLDLLAPVMKVLEQNPNINKISQCEELLSKISNSLLKNRSLNGEQLLVFLFSIIDRGISLSQRTKINDEKQQRDYGEKPDAEFIKKTESQQKSDSYGIQMQWVKTKQHVSEKKTQEVCGRVLASFGLKCLKKALQTKGLILNGDEHEQRNKTTIDIKSDLVERLDPFVPLLLGAFKTFYNPIIVTTLTIMIHVIHLGLPSFKSNLRKFLGSILKLFASVDNTDTEFLNSLFKCATELIRTYSVFADLSELQIKTLVQIIKTNISNLQSQANVFNCLRAIIYRKFLCPDLYDLMETVQEMMVQTVSHNTREICANIFVQFIIEYPLEQKRLEQHINGLLKNLAYFDPDGRLQLIDTLHTLVEKFPQKLLDQFTELFFFTLFLRAVNEEDAKCRAKVVSVMSKIASKTALSRQLVETVFKMQLKSDQKDEKADCMMQGKLQMIQIFAQAGKLQKEDIARTVSFTAAIIAEHATQTRKIVEQRKREAAEATDNEMIINPKAAEFLKAIDLGESSDEVEEQIEAPNWNQVYLAVLCIENLFATTDSKAMLVAVKSQVGVLEDISFLAFHHDNCWVRLSTQRIFGHIFASINGTKQTAATVFALDSFIDLQKFMYQMLGVFNCAFVSQDLAKQLVKNLVFLTKEALQSEADLDEISKIFSKASFIGRKVLGTKTESTATKLLALLQYYSAILSLLLQQNKLGELKAFTSPILKFVYRTYTDEQLETDIKDLSTQIVDTFSENLEKDFFISQFNEVQLDITRARSERKLKEKLMVGTVEGQLIKARKRLVKSQKNKEKHRQQVQQRKFLK